MRRRRPLSGFKILWASIFFLSGCEGIQIGGDALSTSLHPRLAQVCRDAVSHEMAERGLTGDQVRRIHYQAIRERPGGGTASIRGFEAWVYPKQSPGVWVVELTDTCQVARVWSRRTG